jgi:hypothetical protein
LFEHDKEMAQLFQKQVEELNMQIASLEDKLRYSVDRSDLHAAKVGQYNEVQTRVALQRHLRLEQHRHQACSQALQALQLQYNQMTESHAAISQQHEMVLEEARRSRYIIEDMDQKISEYELERLIYSYDEEEEQPHNTGGESQ